MQKKIIAILCIVFSSIFLNGQEVAWDFVHFNAKQGLCDNLVTSSVQDKFGFLWFASRHGLMRYNGYEFATYQQTVGDTTTLSSNHVQSLYVCASGKIAVGTARGLNIFQHSGNTFKQYLCGANRFSSSAASVSAIAEDLTGGLWVGTNNQQGLYRIDLKTGSIRNWRNRVPSDKTLLSNTILSLCCDYYGVIWIGTDEGLLSYDAKQNTWKQYSTSTLKKGFSEAITALCVDEQNMLWIGTPDGFYNLNRKNGSLVQVSSNTTSLGVNQISNINENTLALSTVGSGVLFYNTATLKWSSILHNPINDQGISSNTIQSFLKDREGNIWIAAGNYGLDVHFSHKEVLNKYVANPKNPLSLSFSSVTTIYEDSNRKIWIGTDGGGLNLFDKQTETFKHYLQNSANNQSLASNNITSIIEDASGIIWIGTTNGGLHAFNPQKGTFTRYQHDPANTNSLSNNNVSDLFIDSSGTIWIATLGGGVDAFIPKSKTFTHFKVQYGQSNCISSNYISSICQDMHGNLWFGTQGNYVDRFSLQNKRFFHYASDKGISSEFVNNILRTSDGTVWVATANGLCRYDAANNSFASLKQGSGLPSNEILGLTEISNDSLWIATSKGLCLYNVSTRKSVCYNVFDGLLSNTINQGALLLASDGRLYLGSPLGLNCIKPHQLKRKTYTYPLLITDFQVFKNDSVTELHHKDLLDSNALRLSYSNNSIAIDYQALTINDAKNIRYVYKLEGLHNSWVKAGNQRRAIFIQLKEGDYTFRLKAFVDDHELSQQVAVSFKVLSPWWRSWWMYCVYTIIILAISYLIWLVSVLKIKTQNRIALEQKEREKLSDVFAAKMNLFTEISHDIRTPLTLVIEPIHELIEKHISKQDAEFKQLERISVNAQKILQLTNQLLDFRRLDAGGIRLLTSESNIVTFCEKTVTGFTDLARQRGITLSVTSAERYIPLWFDSEKLEKVLDNLIANAIKYTESGGRITISIAKKTDAETYSVRKWFKKQIVEHQFEYIQITVSDTGCGIRQDMLPHIFERFYNIEESSQSSDKERGHGLGLFIVKHLVELHYGKISVESEPEKGSSFMVQLPTGNSHLRPEEILSVVKAPIPSKQEEEEKIAIQSPTSAEVAEQSAKPVVLVVDDERDIVQFIIESLEDKYQIISCGNGRDALALAEQTVPDAIIADVMMPFMDGFELCAAVKKNIITCHIPVVLLTARNLHESKLKGFESGADAYLTKPFSMKELIVRLESLLENRRRLTNYFKQSSGIAESSDVNAVFESQGSSIINDPFIEKANTVIDQYYNDPDFSVVKFAEEMFMSRSQLFRKLKAVTDVTPNDYIRTFRLQKAAQLLRSSNHLSISEVAYEVGFTSLQYFSSCFQRHYGMTPSEYIRQEVNH